MRTVSKRVYSIVIVLALVFGTVGIMQWNVKADDKYPPELYGNEIKNNDIKYTFKDGTLTAEGTGYADASYSCSKNGIKKIVIKKGIKGIADGAFSDCTKIQSVSIPSTVKQIGFYAFQGSKLPSMKIPKSTKEIGATAFYSNNKFSITMPGDFKTIWNGYLEEDDNHISYGFKKIYLNSPYKPANKTQFDSDKIYTAKSDPKYKSYKGVVYSKNGKTLVQVPSNTKNVKVRKGCNKILKSALFYFRKTEGEVYTLLNPKKVNIPSTVKKVKNDISELWIGFSFNTKWTIKTKKLNGTSIETLCDMMSWSQAKKFLKSKYARINKKYKNMKITKDNILILYTGKSKTVKIPSKVKRIGTRAFYDNDKIKKVILNKKLKAIGKVGFGYCSKLKTVKWNKKLKKVQDNAFEYCNLKKLKVPSSVKKWGKAVFATNKSTKISIPKNMKVIPERMFENNKVKNLVVPKTVRTVGEDAFCGSENKTITIKNGVKKIGYGAFGGSFETVNKVIISKTVQTIGDYAFSGKVIKKLVIKNSNVKMGEDSFYEVKLMDLGNNPSKYITYASISSSSVQGDYNIIKTKVKYASGMEIQASKKTDYSNPYVKSGITNKTGSVMIKTPDGYYNYLRIRVYTNKNGKKIYGPWRAFGW